MAHLNYQFVAAYPKRREGKTQPFSKTFTLQLDCEFDPSDKTYCELEVRISHMGGDLSQPMNDLLMLDKSINEIADSVDWWEVYQQKYKYEEKFEVENNFE